jgi:hypothetical protein
MLLRDEAKKNLRKRQEEEEEWKNKGCIPSSLSKKV